MELKIGGENFEMILGLKAIDYLDRTYRQELDLGNGISIPYGTGINFVNADLTDGNPMAIFNMIRACTLTSGKTLHGNDIEKFMMEAGEGEDGLQPLFDDFLSLLETSPLTKSQIRKNRESGEKAIKEMKKKQKRANS